MATALILWISLGLDVFFFDGVAGSVLIATARPRLVTSLAKPVGESGPVEAHDA